MTKPKKPKYYFLVATEDGTFNKLTEKEYQQFIKNFEKEHDIDCDVELEIYKVQLVDKRIVESVYRDIIKEEY